MTVGITLAYGR